MKTIGIIFTLFIPFLLFSQSKEFNLSKGKDELTKENFNQAIYYFNLAIEEDSIFIEAYLKRGLAKYNIGDHEGAMKDYQSVIQIEPENARAYFGIGSVKNSFLNDKYGAIADYTKAIDISLKNGNEKYAGFIYFVRSDIKEELGDEKGYIDDLKKASELGEENSTFILEMLEKIK